MVQDRIREDLNKSIKEKNQVALSTLRILLSVIQDKEKKKRYLLSRKNISEKALGLESRLSEEEMIEIISSEVKKRKESIKEFGKGGREDLVQKEKEEMELLFKYLPEQILEEELAIIIKKAIKDTGANNQKDIGKVMAKVMPIIKGRADGSEVGRLVKEYLS